MLKSLHGNVLALAGEDYDRGVAEVEVGVARSGFLHLCARFVTSSISIVTSKLPPPRGHEVGEMTCVSVACPDTASSRHTPRPTRLAMRAPASNDLKGHLPKKSPGPVLIVRSCAQDPGADRPGLVSVIWSWFMRRRSLRERFVQPGARCR